MYIREAPAATVPSELLSKRCSSTRTEPVCHLADRGHPASTLTAAFGLRAMRAVAEQPLSPAEIKACQTVVRHRAGEEADDPTVEPGPLQADAIHPAELRLMVRTTARCK